MTRVMEILKDMVRLSVERNSLYLFSGLCLLLGGFLSMGEGGEGLANAREDLLLYGSFKFYEMLAVLCAFMVFRRLRVVNDGILVACVSLVLILDPTLFNTQFYSYGWSTGVAVNALALAMVALELVFLHRMSGLPISARAVRGFLATACVIHLGPALFSVDTTGQGEVLYLLCWAGFLVSILMRSWSETDELVAKSGEYWIYYRYFDFVLVVYPLLALSRHLSSIAGVFDTVLSGSHVSPLILGFVVLVLKISLNRCLKAPGPISSVIWIAVLFSASGSTALDLGHLGSLDLSAVRMSLLASALLLLALHVKSSSREVQEADERDGTSPGRVFLLHAGVMIVLFFAGAQPKEIIDGIFEARTQPLATAWLLSLIGLQTFRTFNWALALSCLSGVLVTRVTNLTPEVSLFVGYQVTGHTLFAIGLMSREWRLSGAVTGLFVALTAHSWACVHALPFSSVPETVFLLQVVLSLIIGRAVGPRVYARIGAGFGGLHLAVTALSDLRQINWTGIAHAHGGHALIVIAFISLFMGFGISWNRRRILDGLAVDDGILSSQAVIR